jgi:hypothetical protein
MRATLVIMTLFGAALAGCGQQAADQATQSVDPLSAGATAASDTETLWASGERKPLDIQAAHPNGVVLQLTSLQSRPTETVIGVRSTAAIVLLTLIVSIAIVMAISRSIRASACTFRRRAITHAWRSRLARQWKASLFSWVSYHNRKGLCQSNVAHRRND